MFSCVHQGNLHITPVPSKLTKYAQKTLYTKTPLSRGLIGKTFPYTEKKKRKNHEIKHRSWLGLPTGNPVKSFKSRCSGGSVGWASSCTRGRSRVRTRPDQHSDHTLFERSRGWSSLCCGCAVLFSRSVRLNRESHKSKGLRRVLEHIAGDLIYYSRRKSLKLDYSNIYSRSM